MNRTSIFPLNIKLNWYEFVIMEEYFWGLAMIVPVEESKSRGMVEAGSV